MLCGILKRRPDAGRTQFEARRYSPNDDTKAAAKGSRATARRKSGQADGQDGAGGQPKGEPG